MNATTDTHPREAVLRRLRILTPDDGRVFVIRGVEVEAEWDDAADVEIPLGPVGDGSPAWWELPLPPCPDCGGGVITWWEAGLVPGARRCMGPARPGRDGRLRHDPAGGCGSLFTVVTRDRPGSEGGAQ